MTEDETAHVHLRLDPSTKQNWESYVENSEHTTLSGLIRVAVQDKINSDVRNDSDYADLIDLINEQNKMIMETKEQNKKLLRLNEGHKNMNGKILDEIAGQDNE